MLKQLVLVIARTAKAHKVAHAAQAVDKETRHKRRIGVELCPALARQPSRNRRQQHRDKRIRRKCHGGQQRVCKRKCRQHEHGQQRCSQKRRSHAAVKALELVYGARKQVQALSRIARANRTQAHTAQLAKNSAAHSCQRLEGLIVSQKALSIMQRTASNSAKQRTRNAGSKRHLRQIYRRQKRSCGQNRRCDGGHMRQRTQNTCQHKLLEHAARKSHQTLHDLENRALYGRRRRHAHLHLGRLGHAIAHNTHGLPDLLRLIGSDIAQRRLDKALHARRCRGVVRHVIGSARRQRITGCTFIAFIARLALPAHARLIIGQRNPRRVSGRSAAACAVDALGAHD